MGEFTVVVQESRTGPFIARTLVGRSASEITSRLMDCGTAVAKVIERRDLHPLARSRISIKDVVYFMEQIENTLFLGMEPRLALKACAITISESSKSGRNLQLVVAAMERMLAGGESLTSVATHFPNLFSQVAVGLLQAGEGSGSLDESFRSIRVLMARNEDIRHQTSMMVLQPAITLLMAILTVGTMIVYIVPQFRSLLDYLGGTLPWQTELMIAISDMARRDPFLLAAGLAACLYGMLALPSYVKHHAWTHRILMRIPGISRYLLAGIRTNFVAAFAQLKKSKMTNASALTLLKDISWYYPYRTAIARAQIGLRSGQSLAHVLAAESDILGERNIQYFRFIEETGSDIEQLERLAILMNRDLDADIERLKTVLNPVILIALALIVGMIAAAIILPMYEIYNRI